MPLVARSSRKKLSQFFSAALAFTTTVSLSGFALVFAFTASAQVMTLSDGDTVKSADNPDVYIVTMSPHGSYQGWKRLILNPEVFNLYGHLSWSNIKTVNQDTLNAYQTSNLVRGENDPKVYVLAPNGDVGTKTWVPDEAAFNAISQKPANSQIQTDFLLLTSNPKLDLYSHPMKKYFYKNPKQNFYPKWFLHELFYQAYTKKY